MIPSQIVDNSRQSPDAVYLSSTLLGNGSAFQHMLKDLFGLWFHALSSGGKVLMFIGHKLRYANQCIRSTDLGGFGGPFVFRLSGIAWRMVASLERDVICGKSRLVSILLGMCIYSSRVTMLRPGRIHTVYIGIRLESRVWIGERDGLAKSLGNN